MKIKQISRLMIAVLAMSTATVSAIPVTLYDNIKDGSVSGAQGLSPFIVSSSFNTASFCLLDCELGNVTIWMLAEDEASVSDFHIELYSQGVDGFTLGTLLTSFTNPDQISDTLAANVFTPDKQVRLSNNADYWVKISVDPLSAGGQWGRSEAVGMGNYIIDYNIPGFPFVNQGSSSPFMYKVEAEALGIGQSKVSPVPVPAAFWLLVTGLVGLIGVGRKPREAMCAG